MQQLVASMAGWKTVLASGLPCLLILFWGSWSDRCAFALFNNIY